MAPQQPSSARDQVRDIVPALVDLSERVLFGAATESGLVLVFFVVVRQ